MAENSRWGAAPLSQPEAQSPFRGGGPAAPPPPGTYCFHPDTQLLLTPTLRSRTGLPVDSATGVQVRAASRGQSPCWFRRSSPSTCSLSKSYSCFRSQPRRLVKLDVDAHSVRFLSPLQPMATSCCCAGPGGVSV